MFISFKKGSDDGHATLFRVYEKEQNRPTYAKELGAFYLDSKGAHVEFDGSNFDFPTLDLAKNALRKAYRQHLAIGYRFD